MWWLTWVFEIYNEWFLEFLVYERVLWMSTIYELGYIFLKHNYFRVFDLFLKLKSIILNPLNNQSVKITCTHILLVALFSPFAYKIKCDNSSIGD